jgi:hypothetical protein
MALLKKHLILGICVAAVSGIGQQVYANTPAPATAARFSAPIELTNRYFNQNDNRNASAALTFLGSTSSPMGATLSFERMERLWSQVATIQIVRTCPSQGTQSGGKRIVLASWDGSRIPVAMIGGGVATPRLELQNALLTPGSCTGGAVAAVIPTLAETLRMLDAHSWRLEITAHASSTTAASSTGAMQSTSTSLFMGSGTLGRDELPPLNQPQPQRPCAQYQVGSPLPTGYGSPYRVFRDNVRLIDVVCSDTSESSGKFPVKVRAGTGASNELIYRYGYIYRQGDPTWTRFDFSSTNPLEGDMWFRGSAEGVTDHSLAQSTTDAYVVAYVCTFDSGRWKCGCTDGACSNSRWQLMKFRNGATGSGGTTGGQTTGSTTSGQTTSSGGTTGTGGRQQ